jgi:hypothetical protein
MIEVRASIQKLLFRDGTFGLKYAREKLSVTLLKGRSSVVRSSSNIGETDVLGASGGEGVSIRLCSTNPFVPRPAPRLKPLLWKHQPIELVRSSKTSRLPAVCAEIGSDAAR